MPLDKSQLRTFANVAASSTDSVLVAGLPGRKIRVRAMSIAWGPTTASTVVFNSKPGGAGTAVSCSFTGTPGFVADLADASGGWFETKLGEGLSVTTGAGSTTGLLVTYETSS